MKLDILRDALLVTLLAMLVYVLYKRLLKILGREKVEARYVVSKEELNLQGAASELHFYLSAAAHVRIAVHDEAGKEVMEVAQVDLKKGQHQFALDLSRLVQGRYYYSITAPGQNSSRYFTI